MNSVLIEIICLIYSLRSGGGRVSTVVFTVTPKDPQRHLYVSNIAVEYGIIVLMGFKNILS